MFLHANQAVWCGLLALGLQFLYMGRRLKFDRGFAWFGRFLLLTAAVFLADTWVFPAVAVKPAMVAGYAIGTVLGVALLGALFVVYRELATGAGSFPGRKGPRNLVLMAGMVGMTAGEAADLAMLPGSGRPGSWALLGAGLFAACGTWVLLSRFLALNRENRETMERLASAYGLLMEQSRFREIGSSAAMITHEIRNYVSALKGNAVLMGWTPAGAGAGIQVEAIRQAAEKLDVMSRDIAAFASASVSAGGRRFRLAGLIEDCIGRHYPDRDGLFVIEEGRGSPEVAGEPERLEQVFLNLFRNSLEAGAGKVRIRITPWHNRLILAVEDDGRGCPADHVAKIGTPFFTGKEALGGTGLGCSIASRILESHGASFRIYSRNAMEKGETGMVVTSVFPAAGPAKDPPAEIVVATGAADVRASVLPPILNLGIRPLLVSAGDPASGLPPANRRPVLLVEEAWAGRLQSAWRDRPAFIAGPGRTMWPARQARNGAVTRMLLSEEALAALFPQDLRGFPDGGA